ncbi:MAG TPA: hypothetical protein VMC61_03690 [Methanocella sp.]|nr:hypothetical protein [Methanocella sp.]
MKLSYGSIIFVLAIFAAVIVAGCSTTSPSGPTATPGGATPAASTAPSGGLTTLGSAIDFSKVHWYEYQMTSDISGTSSTMKMRQDLNVDYSGKKANKVTLNMDAGSGASAMNEAITTYTDVSTGATLGGHMKITSGGQVIMDKDIEAGAAPSTSPGTSTQNPLATYQGMSITNAGSESVTVPAGTYVATKYTWTSGGTTGTVWVAPSVPVPVKMSTSSSGTTMNMELTGWG